MNRTTFAQITGLNKATVYHWGTDKDPFPQWAIVLLAAWTSNKRLTEQCICQTSSVDPIDQTGS